MVVLTPELDSTTGCENLAVSKALPKTHKPIMGIHLTLLIGIFAISRSQHFEDRALAGSLNDRDSLSF
jgi:hypothetical protein